MKNKLTPNYEKEYHADKHFHLYNDEEYYNLRAKVAKKDYFDISPYYVDYDESLILDYGGGLGQNTFLFKNSVVYDKSNFSINFCKDKNREATTNLDSLDKTFDLVLSSEVLEHLENPLKELNQISKKLNDRGILILVLPIDKWNNPNINDKNQHLYNWNFNTITNLLARSGFRPIQYKILRRTGFYKLLPFSRFSFKLYLFLTKLTAIIYGSKHMRIVAVKQK